MNIQQVSKLIQNQQIPACKIRRKGFLPEEYVEVGTEYPHFNFFWDDNNSGCWYPSLEDMVSDDWELFNMKTSSHIKLLDMLLGWSVQAEDTLDCPEFPKSLEYSEAVGMLYQKAGELGGNQEPSAEEITAFVNNEIVPFLLKGD